MKKILFILMLSPIIAFTQNMTKSEKKMRDLMFQLLDSKDVRSLLENKRWKTDKINEFIGEDGNKYFTYSFKNNTNRDYFSISEYSPSSYQNTVLLFANKRFFKSFKNLISNSGYTQKDKRIENNRTFTIFSKKGLEIEFYEKLGKTYRITMYNVTDKEKRKKVLEKKRKEMNGKITAFIQKIDNRLLNASNAVKFEQYDDALFQYQAIGGLLDSIPEEIRDSIDIYSYQNILVIKITELEALKEEREIQEYLKNGLDYFYANKFDLALKEYNKVLIIDPYNQNAKDQIKEIEDINSVLANRRKVHSFKKISRAYYNDLINDLEKGLEEIIQKSEQGSFKMSFVIEFDTSGNNLSSFSINPTSNISKNTEKNLRDLLNRTKNDLTGKSTMIKDYYISSKENINITVNWTTENFSVKHTADKKLTKSSAYGKSNKVNDYIYQSGGRYGKYYIERKDKEVNNRIYKDIILKDYSATDGPSNALYSLILPGLGTKKVTNGEKGSVRMANFFIFATIATGAKLLSNSYYDDYLSSKTQEDIDGNYSSASTFNYIYAGSLTVCGTIYLTDFFSALSKGIKNKKKNKRFRDRVKNGQVNILDEKIRLIK